MTNSIIGFQKTTYTIFSITIICTNTIYQLASKYLHIHKSNTHYFIQTHLYILSYPDRNNTLFQSVKTMYSEKITKLVSSRLNHSRMCTCWVWPLPENEPGSTGYEAETVPLRHTNTYSKGGIYNYLNVLHKWIIICYSYVKDSSSRGFNNDRNFQSLSSNITSYTQPWHSQKKGQIKFHLKGP